jgi:glutamate transport system substrate-binding protein
MSMRITRPAAALAALGLLLVGCSSEAGQQAEQVAENTAAVETEVSFEAGTTMARLNEAGAVTVGTKFDQPGFGLLNPDGQPEGFDVEIAKLVAAKLGIAPEDIKFVETVSANREPFIQNGQVDFVVGIEGPDDLAGKAVCSVEGSTPAQNIRQNYPQAQLVTYDVYSKCADDLKNGNVVAVTTDNVILTGLVAGSPDAFELVGNPFTEEPYGIGLKKGDDQFRDFVNDVLEESFDNGDWADAWDRTAGAITGEEAPEPPQVDRY